MTEIRLYADEDAGEHAVPELPVGAPQLEHAGLPIQRRALSRGPGSVALAKREQENSS